MVNEKLPTPDDWADAARSGSAAAEASSPATAVAAPRHASIAADLLQAIIDAARDGVPNEACGLLAAPSYAADGVAPTRYVSLRNAAASPYRYLIDPEEQLTVWLELEDAGEVPWAIVHSHVASAAIPSATDVGLAFFPDSLYVICSLADPERPTVRAWAIRDGAVNEVPMAVTEG